MVVKMEKRKKIKIGIVSCCIFLGGCSNGFRPLWWGNMPYNEAIDMKQKIMTTPELRQAFENWNYSGKSQKPAYGPKPFAESDYWVSPNGD